MSAYVVDKEHVDFLVRAKAEGGGWVDEVAEMYRAADDHEAQTLDELRRRAGITWECYGEDGESCWTNHRDDPKCDHCGRPR